MFQSIEIITYGSTNGVAKAQRTLCFKRYIIITSQNMDIQITQKAVLILVYILLLIQHILCLNLFLFILNIKKKSQLLLFKFVTT